MPWKAVNNDPCVYVPCCVYLLHVINMKCSTCSVADEIQLNGLKGHMNNHGSSCYVYMRAYTYTCVNELRHGSYYF